MIIRLLVVVVLLVAFALARRAYLSWRQRIRSDVSPVPRLPAELLDGADRTWVLFTTPWCASCPAVEKELRTREPSTRLVKVDATREPYLADAYRVRAAPTVLLADGSGEVRARLVGIEAFRSYVGEPA